MSIFCPIMHVSVCRFCCRESPTQSWVNDNIYTVITSNNYDPITINILRYY